MSRGMPSMMALLGLLAVAGYQNRGKIAEVLGGLKHEPGGGGGGPGQNDQQGGVLGKLGGLLSGASAGSVLSGGLGDLARRAEELGGTMRISTPAGGGTMLSWEAPLAVR